MGGNRSRVLNQAIRRNKARFPEDFMLKLSVEEFVNLKSQFVTSRKSKPTTPIGFRIDYQ
ncbi:ORF6N domain-containing protein [Candidatus Gracilibacteria bacterium]|jgi:hypothetical protein|nr:ORF6N domain-containing protein [Candidatus Gracilibacteria bacterium]